MAERDRPHLFVPESAQAEPYRSRRRTILPPEYPPRDRRAHGDQIHRDLERAQEEGLARREGIDIRVEGVKQGLYFEFESFGSGGVPLRIDRLESEPKGIEVVAVRQEDGTECAVVFVPDGQLGYFIRRVEQYLEDDTKKGEPKHKPLIESIRSVRLATLSALWTEDEPLPDPNASGWWEIWLRRTDDEELSRFRAYANQADLVVAQRTLEFPDRKVILVRGRLAALAGSLDVINDMAEVRRAKLATSDFLDLPAQELADLVKGLRSRLEEAPSTAPAVCVLDTGVNRGHPLLDGSLSNEDCHACDPAWGVEDRHSHGTEMAGLALLGDLTGALSARHPVRLSHRLESVKILPNAGSNPPDLYGKITAEAAARVEITAPVRRRIFSLSIATTDSRDRGQPSSWSAEIDQLAAGAGDPEGPSRLFFVCAGNVPMSPTSDYLDRCDTEGIHDPGQAWNAVTVGSYTERASIVEPTFAGWIPMAEPGELSPGSTTSLIWESQWPIKPEILMEGGNWAISPDETEVDCPESLALLTTHHRPTERPFRATGETSASTAQAARLAAIIRAAYPDAWDETIRALMVHSARWTPPMQARLDRTSSRTEREQHLRRYGYGVPVEAIAVRSAQDALTLIAEGQITPFSGGTMNEMQLHSLPWPLDVLSDLGNVESRLRITLSYFVEPNPGRRGWRKRHQYASHGLRFEVKTPTESIAEFRRRINQRVRDENEDKTTSVGDAPDWFLGPVLRSKGSLHHDVWNGTAADLAQRGVVAVYPVSGWWKDQKSVARACRYSLVISIELPETEIDIYSPVANQIRVPIEIPT